MKRLLVLLLCMMLIVPGALAVELSESGSLPITTDDVTLTIAMQKNSLVLDYEDNYLTHYLEEQTGVKIKFELLPSDSAEAQRKLSLMIASGEKLPDIIQLGLNQATVADYGSQGYFIPLNDYLENDSYFWNLAMDEWATPSEKADILKYAHSADGNIYGYPAFAMGPGDASALAMYVNKQWCDNLGLAIPTTTEELYEVLKAFRDNDANGNGDPNDEIPLIGHTDWRGSVVTFLLNSFVYDCFTKDFNWQLNAKDGKLYAPFTTEAYREGLRYVGKLYSEGLLSSLSFSQGRSELQAILSAPNDQASVVGVFVGHPSQMFGSSGTVDRVNEYVAVPAMIGPENVQYSPYAGMLGNNNIYITCDCENPDLAYRFIDACAQQDISLSIRYGEKDVDWEYTTEGKTRYTFLNYDVVYKTLDDTVWNGENNKIYHTYFFSVIPAKLFCGVQASPYPTPNREYQLTTLWFNTIPLRHFNHPDETCLKLIFNEEEMEQIADIETTVRSYVAENELRFIVGELDVEKDWDAYLNELDTIGLDMYLDVAQVAYSRLAD